MRKNKKKILRIFLCIVAICLLAVLTINFHVKNSTKDQFLSLNRADSTADADCILVLGAGLRNDGTPTPMLEDRLNTGITLYKAGAARKLLMSGDHGRKDYDEVQAMKDYAIDSGIPSSDIFMDHAGFSTYESLYRARDIFQAKKVIIVTQKYHLYRALYIANSLGIKAKGVSADTEDYAGQTYRDFREILARNKDFLTTIFKPEPTFLGEAIPVNGDGNQTND